MQLLCGIFIFIFFYRQTLENENFLIVIKPPARPKKPGKIYFYNETSFDVNLEKDLLTQLRTDYNTIKLPEKLEDEMRRKNMQLIAFFAIFIVFSFSPPFIQ